MQYVIQSIGAAILPAAIAMLLVTKTRLGGGQVVNGWKLFAQLVGVAAIAYVMVMSIAPTSNDAIFIVPIAIALLAGRILTSKKS